MAHIVLLKNNSASHKMGKVLNAFTCSYVIGEEEKFVTFFVLSLRVVAGDYAEVEVRDCFS